MIIGRKYKLPHGTGTLIGREVNDPDRPGHMKTITNQREMGEIQNPNHRYIFELYGPHTWAFEDGLYAAWGNQIKEIE